MVQSNAERWLQNQQLLNELYISASDKVELFRTLKKRWVPALATAVTVFAGCYIFSALQTPEYRSEALILTAKEQENPIGDTSNLTSTYTGWSNPLVTEIQVLKSNSLIVKAQQRLNPPFNKISVDEIADNLTITQVGDSDVLKITYTGEDAKAVQAILDALSKTYIDYSLEKRRSQVSSGVRFIEEQLPSAQAKLAQSAQAIRNFRKRYGVVTPDAYAEAVVGTRMELEKQSKAAEIAVKTTQRQLEEVNLQLTDLKVNPSQAVPISVLVQDTNYQKLLSRLQEVELSLAQQSFTLQNNHPTIENLRSERADLLKLMRQRANGLLQTQLNRDLTTLPASSDGSTSLVGGLTNKALEAQITLATQIAQLNGIRQAQQQIAERFQAIPQLQQQYAELVRQATVNEAVVGRFMERLQELRISEAQRTTSWRILESAFLPTIPVSPDMTRTIFLGIFAGVLAGIGLALLIERLDSRVHSVEAVKRASGLPLLGTVPRSRSSEPHKDTDSPFIEAIRSLGLNLRYLSPDSNLRTIAFTSSIPSEGKSTTVYNLGRMLAELGQKVLIVDADTRNPTIHQIIEQPNLRGLTTAIASDKSWQDMLIPGDIPNLHILTAGFRPPNPIALLDSYKMVGLIDEWRQHYDYILVDTPPVLGVPDIQSIGCRFDGVVMVVAMNGPTTAAVNRAVEILRSSRSNILGVVANMLDREHTGGYYYYSYYYQYYGREEELDGPVVNGKPVSDEVEVLSDANPLK